MIAFIFVLALAGQAFAGGAPYSFGYQTADEFGTQQTRSENANEFNQRTGSYGFTDARGIYRQVNYVADEFGFRAQVDTNEPGTAPSAPAAATYNSAPIAVKTVAKVAAAPLAFAAAAPAVAYAAPVAKVHAAPAFSYGASAFHHAAPVAHAYHAAPVAHAYAAPVAHAYAAPVAHSYATKTVHAAPAYHAAPVAHAYHAAPVAHAYAAPVAHAYAAPVAHAYHAAPVAHSYATKTVHAAPAVAYAASPAYAKVASW